MKKLLFILLALFCTGLLSAQNIEEIIKTPPNPPKLVNDYAGILTPDQKAALERKLYLFDDTSSNQVVVVIVKNLEGKDVADVAIELGRNWGVGNKKSNNGVILLISQTDRKLNISPGYGLEKALPDLVCNQIIQEYIVPHFKGNDYYGGIDIGTDAIIRATKGEFKASAGYSKRGKKSSPNIFLIIIVIVVLLGLFGRGGGNGGSFMSRRGFRGFNGPFIFPGGGGGGGWGGGGSSGGGGFGGFGGGSFGGGGSSGSW